MSGSDESVAPQAPGPGRAAGSDTQPERPDAAGGNPEGSEQTAADETPGAAAGSDGPAQDEATGPDAGPDSGGPRATGRRAGRRRSFWRELPILIAIALLLAVVIKTYFIQAFWIPSGSMENTLLVNDRVLVNKVIYHIRGIHRGDIVVFNGDGSWDPGTVPANGNIFQQFANGFASMFGFGNRGDILIKRVIGIPGDRVVCCDAEGRVTVNGVALTEQSYLYPGSAPSLQRFEVTVPSGRLWVMGDNRYWSADSRDHMGDPGGGTIPESAVIGRAFIIIWPPSRWSILPIPATFSQPRLGAAASAAAGSAQVLPGRLSAAGPAWPLAFGFIAATPLTWAQRRVRRRISRRRGSGRRP